MKFKVATVQMNVTPENKEVNAQKALKFYDEAVAEGAKVVLFPEYFLTFPPHAKMTKEYVRSLAEPIPGGTYIEQFRAKAKATKTYCIAGSMLELCEDGKVRNTSALIGPDGEIIGKYHKIQPENAPAKNEPAKGVYPGNELPVFDTELGRFAIMIDMDLTAPEVPRIYGLQGADIIFAPIAWSAKFISGIFTQCMTGSMCSHAYVAFSSPTGWRKGIPLHSWAFADGTNVDLLYGGGTGIVYGGNVLGGISIFTEGVAVATVDTDKVKKARENDSTIYPFWRRPDLYGLICDPKTNHVYGTDFNHDSIDPDILNSVGKKCCK